VWRVLFDWTVVALSVVAILITLVLLKPPQLVKRRWIPRSLAWIACVLLLIRGVAGIIVDGTSDLIWAPAFTIGGVLVGTVAWMSGTPDPRETI
jgi:ABC-type glucose/galactose transport system permease subunit